MYNVNKNNYNKNPKNSTVYTPEFLAQRVYEVVKQSGLTPKVLLDPSVGTANLLRPFKNTKKIGVDIDDVGRRQVNQFIKKKFEDTTLEDYKWMPDLVVCNPPFNGCSGKRLYPEVFLKHIVELFGDVPTVLITPYGLRLNQKMASPRWQWMRDNTHISSIMTLPLDVFEGKKFHTEVLFFNLTNIKAHYFLN